MAEGTLRITVSQIRGIPGKRKLYARIATPSGAAAKTHPAKSRDLLCELPADALTLRTAEADEEFAVSVYEHNLIGSDDLIGVARVSLWTVITERSQLLSGVPLMPPPGTPGARHGQPVGEVALRLDFTVAPRGQQSAAAAAAQWQQPQQQQWAAAAAPATAQWQQAVPAASGWDRPAAAAAAAAGGYGSYQPAAASAAGATSAYPTIGAMGAAPSTSAGAAASPSPWEHYPNAVDSTTKAAGAAAPASPYPQHPTTYAYQPQAAPANQPQAPAGVQYGYPLNGGGGAAAAAPHGWPHGYPQQAAQQLPTMPVVYGNQQQPGRPGASKPGGSGPGFGMGLLGGVAAALALDAIF